MTVKSEPVNPMDRFNARYGSIKKKTTAEQSAPAEQKDEDKTQKKEEKKERRTTNDLSELAEILEEAKTQNDTPKAEETNKGEETMTEPFTLTDIQKEACSYLGIDPATIKNEEALKKAFAGKIEIQGNRIIDLAMESLVYVGKAETKEEKALEKSAEYSLRDDGLDPSDLPSKPEEIIVREQDTPAPQPTPAEHTDMHWIDEKIRDYTEIKNDGNVAIKDFNGDKTAGTFTAKIDNSTVTYTSPNDVSVTKDSSYKVFDTMMKEPSNAGKAVRLPEDATAEFRTNLFVAAVLNGHKVNGAEGLELDEATLAKIGLTPEQKAQVLAALPKQEEATQEKTTQEKPSKEKPSEKVAENEPLPGPYNPAQHRINHILERKNMLDALAKGTAENVKPDNPDKPTFIFKNAQNSIKKGESR